MMCHLRTLLTVLIVGLAAGIAPSASQNSQNAAEAERLIKGLDLHPGSVVAEIGAGDGAVTVLIARAVGETGRVFSNEVNGERMKQIARAAAQAGLNNVTTVAGEPTDTKLPEQCCDAVFMKDVYHHFADPAAMNASILRALRPGGKLAVLDFGPPPGAESADPAGRDVDGHHGITPATLERELRAAGFEILSTEEYGFRSSLTVARRPR